MSIDLYCGRCHRWLDDRSPAERGDNVCHCLNSDLSKNPNCRNNLHEHHDPQSPIVLSNQRIRESEEAYDTGVYDLAHFVETGEYIPPRTVKEPEEGPAVSAVEAARRLTQRTVADSQPVFKGPDLDNPERVMGDPHNAVGFVVRDEPTDRPGSQFAEQHCSWCGRPHNRTVCPHCGHKEEHVVHNGSPCDECGALITDDHLYHVAVFNSATGEILGWRPLDEPMIDEKTRAALDAILRETNEQVED
ncbi:hypothetical protein LCGC14_1782810 [marine sediment metagenome]|uniref:Uncharacterized protein n=1 Tax=marine sediment metagenome TaxID=412755 RepID=A0A0F9GUT9_9ZZZZ